MLLRAGVHVRTAPPALTGPWECVWRNKDGLRCHVGRVYDQAMFEDGAERYSQNQFPRKKPSTMTLIGGQVVTNAPAANMSNSSTSGFSTSSVKLKYKTNFGYASYDDTDLDDIPESGYAFWPEGKFKGHSGAVYLILSKLEKEEEAPKWVLSICDDSDAQPKDFRIAAVAGSQCIQLWGSDIVFSPSTDNMHPFKVIKKGVENEVSKWSVVTGSVNNIVPTNMSEILSVENGWVWVKSDYDAGSKSFPGQTGVTIGAGETLPSSSTTSSYVALAQITAGTQAQLITGSLWGDRIQLGGGGTQTAQYYYAKV